MSRHTARVRAGNDRASLCTEITDKIIAELEAGRIPWVQPWGTAAIKAPLAMPRNASTQRGYAGINVLILWDAVIKRGFSGQSWLTFRQALSLSGNVRKGERGTTIVYADRFLPTDQSALSKPAKTPKRSHSSSTSLHSLQCQSMRRSAGRGCEGRATRQYFDSQNLPSWNVALKSGDVAVDGTVH